MLTLTWRTWRGARRSHAVDGRGCLDRAHSVGRYPVTVQSSRFISIRYRRLSWCALVLTVDAIVWATLTQIFAEQIPLCERPAGVEERSFPSGIPIGLRNTIKDKFGEIVPPGGKFDSTDLVETGKSRRAIFVWVRDRRWVIATEHGGRGYNDPVYAFDVIADGSQATLVAEEIAFPDSLCAI